MLELNISTILLQMANFFILALILFRFLFKPLQSVLKKRENEINQEMESAAIAKKEAEELRRRYEEKSNNIDAEISARKNEARIIIEQTRQQMLQEVQTEIEQLQTQTEETLTKLQSEAIQQHKHQLGNLAADFSTGILSNIMSPELEMIYQREFLKKISQINLSEYLENIAPGEIAFIRVIMSHSITEDFKNELNAIMQDRLTSKFNLIFEVDPSLIAGGILRFENELIDGSLKGQIDLFQKRYQETV